MVATTKEMPLKPPSGSIVMNVFCYATCTIHEDEKPKGVLLFVNSVPTGVQLILMGEQR